MNNDDRNDADRVGLSESSRIILEELVSDRYFKDNMSAYRMAFSFAIYNNIDISEHSVYRPQGHMYLISQIDPKGHIANVIKELYPSLDKEVYRSLEKFADLGLPQLQKALEANKSIAFWK